MYYLAENTGLVVKNGDLVIVEADRGYDLGTVMRVDMSWEEARREKEASSVEHLRWLTMFSRNNLLSEGQTLGNTAGMMANAGSDLTVGGLNTSQTVSGLPSMSNPFDISHTSTAELKPRMVKRLAQSHEIATLRDKEGYEARAKRVCQQKVIDYKLNMEILDAELQV